MDYVTYMLYEIIYLISSLALTAQDYITRDYILVRKYYILTFNFLYFYSIFTEYVELPLTNNRPKRVTLYKIWSKYMKLGGNSEPAVRLNQFLSIYISTIW